MAKFKWEVRAQDALHALHSAHDKMRKIGNPRTVNLIESALSMYYFEYMEQINLAKRLKKPRRKK